MEDKIKARGAKKVVLTETRILRFQVLCFYSFIVLLSPKKAEQVWPSPGHCIFGFKISELIAEKIELQFRSATALAELEICHPTVTKSMYLFCAGIILSSLHELISSHNNPMK